MIKNKIGIIGAGLFGTAINKVLLTNKKNEVLICDIEKKDINNFTTLKQITKKQKILVFAISSQYILPFLEENKVLWKKSHYPLICSKGIDSKSGQFLSDIFTKYFPRENITQLSGPAFAKEIRANPKHVRLHVSGNSSETAKFVSSIFCNGQASFSSDILTFDITNALKNVAAMISGMSCGYEDSLDVKFALIGYVYSEIGYFVEFFGGDYLTCMTNPLLQADLYMTASQEKSRNFCFGKLIGAGVNIKTANRKINSTIESHKTIKAVGKILKKEETLKEKMPIVWNVYLFMENNISLKKLVSNIEKIKLGESCWNVYQDMKCQK